MVDNDEVEAYVRAALALSGHTADERRMAEIIGEFRRITDVARVYAGDDFELRTGPAFVFRP